MIDAVSFDDIHSYRDLHLVLTSKKIEAPKPKTYYVELDGADGSLDFTDAFGDVKYDDREITMEFTSLSHTTDYLWLWSEIQNKLHGKKFNITFDSDPDYYYVGRCDLDRWSLKKNIGSFSIVAQCEPYKYRWEQDVRVLPVSASSVTYIIANGRRQVMPTFSVSGDEGVVLTVGLNGETESVTLGGDDGLTAGDDGTYSFTDTGLVLAEGNNLLTVSATSAVTLTVTYRQGSL